MSTQNPWRYRINTFDANTIGSNVKMLSIASDTYAKLKAEQADIAIGSILLFYEPPFFAYRDICQQYDVRVGNYRGATLSFEQTMDLIPLKLREWESSIRAVYIEDSPKERAIFPSKRTPFESGTYEDRLNAIGALYAKLSVDPVLMPVSGQVSSFYNSALAARLAQQVDEGSLNQLSDLRENKRLQLSTDLMGVLGQLLFIHRTNLEEVDRYFDLSMLREPGVDDISGSLAPNALVNVKTGSHTITPDTRLKIYNLSSVFAPLIFGFAETPDSAVLSASLTLNPGESVEKTIAELGYNTANHYLNILNKTALPADWKIIFL